MALSLKARKRLTLAYLCVALPLYIGVAVAMMSSINRPPLVIELAAYVALGVLWAWPLRSLARGTGRGTSEEEEMLRKERKKEGGL